MRQVNLCADFVGPAGQQLLILAHHPSDFSGRCVLVCPPFAEEMNKCRKMFTELAKQLCAQGVALVVPDLFGTGDSAGDFADATWERWLRDIGTAEAWITNKGWRVDTLLGVRLGCLLAAQYAGGRSAALSGTYFWQPTTVGARALDQFLRLRVAASLMSDAKETVAGLKAQLAAGEVVEVAGYGLASPMARALDELKLTSVATAKLGQLHWYEILRSADASVSVPSVNAIEQIQKQAAVSLHTVVGEPFWAATEIVCLPELLASTSAEILSGARHD